METTETEATSAKPGRNASPVEQFVTRLEELDVGARARLRRAGEK